MSAVGGRAEVVIASPDFRVCEGFRMPAHDDGATHTEGRRTQTSKGDAMRQTAAARKVGI